MKRKVTEAEIVTLEQWADERKHQPMNEYERHIVQQIEYHRKNNWKGCRAESGESKEDDARATLERLKKKQV